MRCLWIFLLLIVLLGQAYAESEIAERLISTSNQWGCVLNAHRQGVLALAAVVATNGEAQTMLEWYQNLSTYPNFLEDDARLEWIGEKAFLMRYFSDIKPISQSTNCWFSAARELGRRRDSATRLNAALENLSPSVQTNLTTDSAQAIFDRRRELKYQLYRLQNGERFLIEAVTNVFPRNVLPTIPPLEQDAIRCVALDLANLQE